MKKMKLLSVRWSSIGLSRFAFILVLFSVPFFASSCSSTSSVSSKVDSSLSFPNEKRITKLRQMTFGGTNAEAYWSFDGKALSFQHSGEDATCDQIYTIGADRKNLKKISNGEGRTTCAFFTPDNERVIYSSTHASGKRCPPEPDRSKGYAWPIYPTYQFYSVKKDGTDLKPLEPGAPSSYNAEMTLCQDGKAIFTSDRNGDLDLYTGKIDSKGFLVDVKQITHDLGYDGGAFFSPDCSKIVWRASRPKPGKETREYISLLKQHLIKPGVLEIWIADADGSNAQQVTKLGVSSFAPYFVPGDGKDKNDRILFSSNLNKPGGRNFDLFMIKTNGTELEQITFSKSFDSFPMFSPDGKYLAFSSNRNARQPRETNVFIADWNGKAPGPLMTDEDPNPVNRYFAITQELSSKELEGRRVGTVGLERAESYVIDLFQKVGLKEPSTVYPFKNKVKGYEHPVEIINGVDADWPNTVLKADWRNLKAKEEFAPAGFSSVGEFKGQIIDVGYGLMAPELGLDDYAGKNVQGKVVLIRRHVPPALNLTPSQEASQGDLKYKTFVAREKGAKAVIFWEAEGDEEKENLTFSLEEADGTVSTDAGLPVMIIPKKIAREWIAAPKAVIVGGSVSLKKKKTVSNNIIGFIGNPAQCRKQNPIVIGAHLDHLGDGRGGNSLDTGRKIHPGADDNASGVAALVEISRQLQANPNGGCYLITAFTGEEIGLVGSSRMVELLKNSKVTPKAMLNLDMVGRLRNNAVLAFGTGTAKEWDGILKAQCPPLSMKCVGKGDGYGPSDHMPFYIAKTPVLHFFTGAHEDYHKSTDTADRVNATGGVQIAELVAAVARDVVKKKMNYVHQKSSSTFGQVRMRGDRKGKGAYLGTIPNYADMASGEGYAPKTTTGVQKFSKEQAPTTGVLLAGVRPDSPASEAGILEGDIIIGVIVLDEMPGYTASHPKSYGIQNIQDYTFVLSNLTPGMRIKVKVYRKDKELSLPVTVGRRTSGS